MAFTAGYKVNEGTQYEFTVSNETIPEMVQASDSGIGEADLGPYCYSALIDSRVYKLFAAQGNYAWPNHTGADAANWAKTACPGILEGWDQQLTSAHPAFNKELLDGSDTVYQRNFLVWEGTIYPGTENEKTGTFLVMDMVDIKRWYCNFDNAGFGTGEATSAIGEEAPEGYVWPGYTGPTYHYYSNGSGQYPDILCDNNDPQLNPNTNLKVKNILVVNDEYWVGSLNPSTHGTSYMGGSGCSYAGRSLYGWFWNMNSNAGYLVANNDTCYQYGSLNFMGLPDYSSAPECPGAPRDNIGSLTYACYAVCDNDNIIANLSGNWGQQNYATGVSFENNCHTTQLTSILKWQSWCGLKFQYQDTMYKPIISGGIVIGYSDDMDAESEYDDMTNVTGNNVSPTPPGPTPPSPSGDDPWDGVDFGGSSGGGGAFAKFYYMTSTELANLRTWMNSNSVPEKFDPMAQIIGLSQVPVAISGSDAENVTFVNSSALYNEGQNRLVDSGVATQRGLGRTIVFNLGSVDIPRRMQQRGEPYLDYSCAVELYLPFCGIFSLDTQAVMGRTITAQLVLDPTSGSITGYAWVTESGQKLPVAYGSGQVGVDLPISAQQYSMSKGALSQANANFSQSILHTAFQAMVFAGTKGANAAESAGDAAYARGGRGLYSNVRNAEQSAMANEVGSYAKAQAASNVVDGFFDWGRSLKEISYGNNTAIGGSFGGTYASWSNPFTAYVKIIRPKVQKPSNYNHTQAVPCVEARTVASCTGLIQCIGVDTSSITNATSSEREAIAAALSNGVYAGR